MAKWTPNPATVIVAMTLAYPTMLDTPTGAVRGLPGDYLVTYPDQSQAIIPAASFNNLYVYVPGS